jgi:hypothetical protein
MMSISLHALPLIRGDAGTGVALPGAISPGDTHWFPTVMPTTTVWRISTVFCRARPASLR